MAKKAGFAFRVNQEITGLFKEYGRLKTYSKGETIVKQGDYSSTVYIILSGEADVLRKDRYGNENKLATLQTGDIVGEMGAFLDNKRSANVRAVGEVKALECPNQMFIKGLFSTHELTYRVLKNFAERISDLNGQVSNHYQSRLMLVVGYYLNGRIKEGKTVQDIEIELDEVTAESRLEHTKIIDALCNFKSLKAITKMTFPAEISVIELSEGDDGDDDEEVINEVEIEQAESGKVIIQLDIRRFKETMKRISYA